MVRKTLLSAALQEYPFLRVVLLLDDPPNPTVGGAQGVAGGRPADAGRADGVARGAARAVRRHPRGVRDVAS